MASSESPSRDRAAVQTVASPSTVPTTIAHKSS
jgi:hypothetical protein